MLFVIMTNSNTQGLIKYFVEVIDYLLSLNVSINLIIERYEKGCFPRIVRPIY